MLEIHLNVQAIFRRFAMLKPIIVCHLHALMCLAFVVTVVFIHTMED